MSRKVILAWLLGIFAVLTCGATYFVVTTPKRVDANIADIIKRYNIATNGADVTRGLETKEDNAADLIPDLQVAVKKKIKLEPEPKNQSAYQRAVSMVRLNNGAKRQEVYLVASKMAKRKNWYVERNWDHLEKLDFPESDVLPYAGRALVGNATKKSSEGKFAEACADLKLAAGLAKLVANEPYSVGQYAAQGIVATSLKGIAYIASQPDRSRSECEALIAISDSMPEFDFPRSMRGESLLWYRIATGQRMAADPDFEHDEDADDLFKFVFAGGVLEYTGKCKEACETLGLDEAQVRVTQLRKEGLQGLAGLMFDHMLNDFSEDIRFAKYFRQRKLMLSEGIRAIVEHRVPNAQRDWTGSKKDQTVVSGTAEDWTIVARGKDGVFNEKGYSQTNKEDPKDLFLIYRAGRLLFLGS